jgi:hypothetical protein
MEEKMAKTSKWAALAAVGLILSACAPTGFTPVPQDKTTLSIQSRRPRFIYVKPGNTCGFTAGDEASLAAAVSKLPMPVVITKFDFASGAFDYATDFTVLGDTLPVVWTTGTAQPQSWETPPAGVITGYDAESGQLSAKLTADATPDFIDAMENAPLSTILDHIAVD